MRVLVKEERGATLVIIALSMVALLGMGAIAIDVGMSIVNKRGLQKSADAASLAAASEIIKLTNPTENCSQIVARWDAGGTFRQQIENVADTYAANNTLLNSQRADIQVRCSTDNKRVEVTYANRGTTQGPFGGILGGSTITKQRSATADVFVRDQGTGLRPYFVCDSDLTSKLLATATSGNYAQIKYPSDTNDCDNYNGNWYTADCPNDGNNGTLDENTDRGCLDSVGVVIDQSAGELSISDPAVTSAIVASCTDAAGKSPTFDPHTCLLANPGNIASNVVVKVWDKLLELPGIAVPTFDQEWNDYADANVTECKGGGNGGCYPIEAIAGVKVCAYKWGPKFKKSTDTTACPGISSLTEPPGNKDYLWLRLKTLQYSGSSTPGNCPIGGNCDLGGRGTRLIL